MKIPSAFKPFGAAALAGSVALTSAFGFAGVLRHEAARHSHQLPEAEQWFEPPSPGGPLLIARGRILFFDSCVHCHGADARGDEGPDLHGVQVSDRYIANIITQGIPHEMPAFRKKYGAAEISALTAYLRALDSP